ncbi:MAG: hypothetical protein ACOC97_00295 [Myxococcota bacterium]
MQEWEEGVSKFRPRSRPLWVAVWLNVALAAVFLGGPFLSGLWRSERGRDRFAEFAACLWDGTPAPDPGLGLPPGEDLRFAEAMLLGPDDWPARCRPALRRLKPEPAWLLLPSVKQAETVIEDAVADVERELRRVKRIRRRPGGPSHVEMRVHGAVERLMAALSNHARTTGADLALAEDAIRFEAPARLVKPTRVPLRSARDGRIHLRARGDGLVADAVDDRGLARAQVGGGGLTLQRIGRPSLVRGLVAGPAERPWVLWAMAEERCEAEPHQCAGHASGVVRLDEQDTRAPRPRWLAGHPAIGDPDRGVRIRRTGDRVQVDLVARRLDGGAEVRRFEVEEGAPAAGAGEGDEAPEPAARRRAWPLLGFARGDEALLTEGRKPRVAWTAREEGAVAARIRVLGAESTVVTPMRLEGAGTARLDRCERGDVVWLALVDGRRARVARLARGRSVPGPPFRLALRDGQRPELACDEERLVVAAADDQGHVALHRCHADGSCEQAGGFALPARTLALGRERGVTLIAGAQGKARQIRIAVWPDDANAPGEPRVVAPCFGDEGGFCGTPTFASRNGRLLLAAREDTDLLVVESSDGGRRWQPLHGLR